MLVISGENPRGLNGNCHAVAGSKISNKSYELVPFLSPFSSSFPPFLFPPITPYYYTPKSPPFFSLQTSKGNRFAVDFINDFINGDDIDFIIDFIIDNNKDFIIDFAIDFVIDRTYDFAIDFICALIYSSFY